ncbi:PQQ-binding-like beta-propeller repeat protein [Paraburkholderia sp. RL18-103-BIB-C]|uniref:outer membrane protein assembly factor BamB family protein n=1 Tax=unclassified Paraburkholderia TaxID=2615204 RepID=UPI0038B82438
MNYAHNKINAARLAAALMLTGMAGSSAQAQSSNAAPAAALAPGLAVAAGASANSPFPHGPHRFGVGPSVAPASALDGSEVDKQNGGDKINPNRFRDDRGPAADTPFQAPEPATLATLARTPGAATAATFTTTDWPTYGMNRQRTGYNPVETVLNATNVRTLTEQHNPTPRVSPVLDGAILTQPVLATGVMIGNVPTDIVYVATEGNTTYALNAADVSKIIWKSAAIPQATLQKCTGLFQGKIGVQGTPVIDHANNRLFVVSGKGYLHAYDMATGADLPGFNLPLLDAANVSPITMVYGGLTLSPDGSSIYVATAGDPCDDTPYHGQVVRASTTNPAAILQRWFPTGASGPDGGGIWGFGGVSIPPDGTVVYALTGNAFATPENAGFAEHVVKLTPTLAVAASNSPLQPAPNADIDFGATAMLFQPRNCPTTMLAAYNKSGILFIYNRATIQQAGPIQRLTISQNSAEGNNIGLPVFDPVLNQLYVVSPSGAGIYTRGLIALSIGSNCSVNTKPVWQAVVPQSRPGTFNPAIPPVAANGVVYYADGMGNDVYAFDATNGTQLFTRHYTPVQTGEGNFAPPTVVNGQVFVAGSDHRVHAYSLP